MTDADEIRVPEYCRCCGLEEAEPEDPDGFCTDCSIECTDEPSHEGRS